MFTSEERRVNKDAIDRLNEILKSHNDTRRAERRINIKLGLAWGAFFAMVILIWVAK